MNCEEFDLLEAGFAPEDESARKAAMEHVSRCSRCAALQESWQAARVELAVLAGETSDAEAPARVEMRLRQEFRTRHRIEPARRAAAVAAWTLATAALLLGLVSVWNWQKTKQNEELNRIAIPLNGVSNGKSSSGMAGEVNAPGQFAESLLAENEDGDFTPLPGSIPVTSDEDAIVRVRMQRASLSALGFPVNEERAGEWIQVELLVGADGQPEALRLPPGTSEAAE
jgi:hypothetical protein